MKNLVLCVTLNLLFFINTVYSTVTVTVSKPKSFKPGTSFTVECNVTYDGDAPTIKWSKDSRQITTGSGKYSADWNTDKKVNTLTVSKTEDIDAANYSCIAYEGEKEVQRESTSILRQIAVDVPNNVNVVEEERLRIECKAVGNGTLSWIFKNVSYNTSKDRVVLENFTYQGVEYANGVIIVEKITLDDRGPVTCVIVDRFLPDTFAEASCMVRVKDKYAALWPFLGICAEVIILCAIIVIYEKKRNKSELEESDTDQSPDQKNTPDQGKDSNLRHRQ